ncbi:MAG: outer membrane beta-barrel protein [Xanthobacteraceae bacterium]
MKKILLATVAVLGFASAASAADLRPLPARPLVAPVFNWTSCYLGGYIGGAWSAESVRVNDVNGYNYTAVAGGSQIVPATYDLWYYDVKSSFLGGGTLGCNWQPIGSPWVIGAEGEIGYLRLTGSALDINDAFQSINSSVTIGDWYGMVTGRLGYAWDRAMVYLKGGVAFVDVDATIFDPLTNPNFFAQSTESLATWTVGGGFEWAFDWNWSVKAEYMYIGLDTVAACGYSNVGGFGPGAYCWNHDLEGIHTAKVGLNYRFGGGAPLVARY